MTSGAMAAVDNAAIDHQLMPCEPVWLATITGSVVASVLVKRAAKKYSFQHRITDRIRAATMPGSAIEHNDQDEGRPHRRTIDAGRLFELDRDRQELIPHDPDHDGQHHQRIDDDQANLAVEHGQLLVEHEKRQGEHDGRQNQLR